MGGMIARAEPSSEEVDAAAAALASCEALDWNKLQDREKGSWRHKAREAIEAAHAAVLPPELHLPGHHPGTCGTAYLIAERSLRIVERMAGHGSLTIDTLEWISATCDEAGVAFARIALRD
ncbi:MAG: hypothetical protein ABJH34_03315, partial [Qipengyuania citrea]